MYETNYEEYLDQEQYWLVKMYDIGLCGNRYFYNYKTGPYSLATIAKMIGQRYSWSLIPAAKTVGYKLSDYADYLIYDNLGCVVNPDLLKQIYCERVRPWESTFGVNYFGFKYHTRNGPKSGMLCRERKDYYRTTVNELDIPIRIRGSRVPAMLQDWWDEDDFRPYIQRNWKKYRKTQWKS